MRRVWLVVFIGLLAACGSNAAEMPTTTTAPPTTTMTMASTTTTVVEESMTTEVGSVVLGEIPGSPDLTVRTKLEAGARYRLSLGGTAIDVSPPTAGWDLLYFDGTMALFGWRGPSGFRSETLNVLVEAPLAGVDAAWSKVDGIGEQGLANMGEPWILVDEGTAAVGGLPADWREYRTPEFRPGDQSPDSLSLHFVYSVAGGSAGRLFKDTSARFYAVPVEDLAAMVMAYETRCACLARPSGDYDRKSQIVDDEENELRDWLPELEAFLASIEFVEG